MNQIEILAMHFLLNILPLKKVIDLWETPRIQGYRTIACAILYGLVYELHHFNIQPFDNAQLYTYLTNTLGGVGVLAFGQKIMRHYGNADLIQSTLDTAVKAIKDAQTQSVEAPKP